ncbi:MAG: hypothetical protein LH472_04655 [Pyrinomonadaceae bacterium]|nr:hypothetical protein [Pyrinomonadaceae bacterium]
MPIDLNSEDSPINPDNPKYAAMLANLQGNILKSHGRNCAAHLFLTFSAEPEKVRRWIAIFTARYITSAYRQNYESKEFNINKISGRIFGGFYLSAAGYKSLGFDNLEDFVEDNAIDNAVEVSFKDGMAAGAMEFNDPPPEEWEEHFRDHQSHALVLLADDDAERLKDVTARVLESLENVTTKIVVQEGTVLRENGKPIEPFGFRDCISQPHFYRADIEKDRENGFDRWDSAAPLKLVLVKDVLTAEEDSFGSYLVYRKLEQNVREFKATERKLAGTDCLNLADDDMERAGALIVGRFRNGVPLELSATENDDRLIDFNNFNFIGENGQPTASKCPYHSHIRRMTPRGELGLIDGKIKEEELRHRLARRGITYDEREKDADGKPLTNSDPEKDVGLLFMCFQSSIPKQFGFVQARWANTSAFFGKSEVGIDPIVGQNPDLMDFEYQKWYPKWGDDAEPPKPFEFKTFVKLKGGEYFFAPSISFLRKLGD